MAAAIVYAGALAPESLQVVIKQGDSGINLTTATSVSLKVQKPSGAVATWSAVILSGVTATQITVQHAFVSGDVVEVGTYAVVAHVTVPAGLFRTTPQNFQVLGEFGADCSTVGGLSGAY